MFLCTLLIRLNIMNFALRGLRTLMHTTALLAAAAAFAAPLTTSTAQAEEKTKRAKVIDFEDELVEGMNKRPLDSLSQLGENGKKRKKPHLYRKRIGFRTETQETLSETRFAQ